MSNRNVAIPFNINKSTPTVNNANLICVNNKKKKGNYTPLHVATLNARSVRNKAHFLSDYILEHDIDILVITETWLYNKGDEATLNQLIPTGYGYEFNNRQQRGGGGVMVIFKHSLNITKSKVEISKSLEIIEILCKTTKSVYRLMGVYRPPPSKKKKLSVDMFLSKFQHLVIDKTLSSGTFLMVGDFNFHVDSAKDTNALKFLSLLNSFNLHQNVNECEFYAPKIWNSLSINTKNCDTFQSFKSRLKTDLFKKVFLL